MIKRTSLITGGAGFIGSHLADTLIANGDQIIVLDDLSGGNKENINKEAIFYQGSICDKALLDAIFTNHNIDCIYHLAAYAAEGLSHFIRHYNYQNNLIGSINLINNAVKYNVSCFVFSSSIAVYGSGQLPLSEHHFPLPEDPYGIAKYAIELDLKCAHEMFGLNYLIFRPHNVYGERQNIADKYRNVIGIFMHRLLEDKNLPIFGDGEQTRAFTYVGDICDVIFQSSKTETMFNQTFNLGSDSFYSINQLAEIVQEALGIKGQLSYLEQRNEVKHAYCSHEKIREQYPYVINDTHLTEGVKKMAEWAKTHTILPTKDFSEIELYKNLPQSWL